MWLHTYQISKTGDLPSDKVYFLPRKPTFWGVLTLCWVYSERILSPVDTLNKQKLDRISYTNIEFQDTHKVLCKNSWNLGKWFVTQIDDLWNRLIDPVGRVFANGPEDLCSIPGRIIPKTFKMVLDTSLLKTQQYKVRIKSKVDQSKERSSALPYTSVL